MGRLTAAQETLFDERMQFWQKRLNLTDWRVERMTDAHKPTVFAEVYMDYGQRAVGYLTGNFPNNGTFEEIDSTARHEMLHVLLHELIYTSTHHKRRTDLLESAEHRVVNTLEKLLTSEAV